MIKAYLSFIFRIRYLIFSLIGISTIFFIMNIESQALSNNEMAWLKGSQEYQRLLQNNQSELLGKTVKVEIDVRNISETQFEELQEIHEFLAENENIQKLDSIFNQSFSLEFDDGEGSSLIELSTLLDVDNGFQTFQNKQEIFQQFISDNEIKFYIFLNSDIKIEKIQTPLEYKVDNLFEKNDLIEESVLLIGLGAILTALLFFSFHTLSAPITGITFLIITSSVTIYIFKVFVGDYTPHISILILSFSISFMDYLYIYYRWFMFQKTKNTFNSSVRTVERTLSPIFFTTLVNILGIGSLIFVESEILQALGLMVIISSVVGFIYSFLFLPIMLASVKIKNPSLKAENFARFFSKKLSNYNTSVLKIFGIFTALLFLTSIYILVSGSYHLETAKSSKIIKLSINHNEMDKKSMAEMEKISQILEIDEVKRIESSFNMIKSIYEKENNSQAFNLDNIDLDRYIFMLDMFSDENQIFNNEKIKIDIYLTEAKYKSLVLAKLKDSGIEIFITDVDSLLQSAKVETINLISILIILIIFIISIVIFIMTRILLFSIIGMTVGLVPIAWFFVSVILLDLPISTEMFVAMIISVAISSDATIHLLHFYKNMIREKRLIDDDGIQKLFLYVESPLILGNILLAVTFLLMVVANISSIMLIGLFSAIIVVLSIFTDIFILPVLILESRKKLRNLE